ncbi:MAG TPA: hypothetical protein P5205_07785 [Candidatus Paceibacterota bacterium]|nr:hypothetical protein [Verrucomicrobiota bacterium]HSA10258.1 hypothetical protein [Candidatus Paceibacterota bacterium]
MKLRFRQAAGAVAVAFVGVVPTVASGLPGSIVPDPGFAIYTLAGPVDPRILARGTDDWSHVTLSPAPVISDADILNYDFSTHTLRLTQEARARLPRPPVSGTPFVVTAEGEPIYLGVFVTSVSSKSFAVPSVMVDAHFRTNQSPNAVVIDRAYPTADFGAGDVGLAWSYGGTSQGCLYFYPSRERVRILGAEAFERMP